MSQQSAYYYQHTNSSNFSILDISIEDWKICGDWRLLGWEEKQVLSQDVQILTITRVLELLYKNLMGYMQVEILVGKRYISAFINDYFEYSYLSLFVISLPPSFFLKLSITIYK